MTEEATRKPGRLREWLTELSLLAAPTFVVVFATMSTVETLPSLSVTQHIENSASRDEVSGAMAALMQRPSRVETAPVEPAVASENTPTASIPHPAPALAAPVVAAVAPAVVAKPIRKARAASPHQAKVSPPPRRPVQSTIPTRTNVAAKQQPSAPAKFLAKVRSIVVASDKRVTQSFASIGEKISALVKKL